MQLGWEMPSETTEKLIKAVKWCLKNLDDFGGYSGWLPSHLQTGRIYGGLSNQAWKDSWSAFMQNDGQLPAYPLHDILSSSAMWAALNKSSLLLASVDNDLSSKAKLAANQLKDRFNSVDKGFRLEYEDFYAEALDKDFNQLSYSAIDVGMAMAFDDNNENIYLQNTSHKLVDKLLGSDFYCEDFGLRTYQKDLNDYVKNDQYHRGPNTFWPFANALVAIGFARCGYIDEAEKVIKSMLKGLANFDTFVELFLVNDGKAEIWKNADSNQTSTLNQVWTAAAAYYGSIYLKNF
jgi:glycogen debranching enzyme